MIDPKKFTDFEEGRILVWESDVDDEISSSSLGGISWLVRCYNSVSSTMDVAAKLATQCGPSLPGLVIAKEQLRGRGRQGRAWHGAGSGFYATYIFVGSGDLSLINPFPLVCACILAESLRDFGCNLYVKWPNDLLSQNGKKISGILTELVKEGDGYQLLVGIGINLVGEPLEQPKSTSLYTLTGRTITPPQLAGVLSTKLFQAFRQTETHGFAPFKERWLSMARGIEDTISINVGNSILSGIFKGVSDQGRLLLEQDGLIREISSGELANGG